MSRLRTLSSYLLVLAGLLGLLLGVVWVVIRSQAEGWKEQGLQALNEQLDGELVTQRVDLSWWNGFPNVSVDFHDLAIVGLNQDTVVQAERLGLEINLWSILQQAPEVTSGQLEHGALRIQQNHHGRWNLLDLAKEGPSHSDSMAFSLSAFQVEDVDVQALHPDGWTIDSRIEAMRLSGSLDQPWTWDARLVQCRWEDHGQALLLPCDYEGSGTVDARDPSLVVLAGEGALQGVDHAWTIQSGDSWELQLDIKSLSQQDLARVMVDPPTMDGVALDHVARVKVNAQPDDVLVQWELPIEAFQLEPQATGLSLAIQGLIEGRGFVKQRHGVTTWGVDQFNASGAGWSVQGAVQPEAINGFAFSGNGSLDATIPVGTWVPDLHPDLLKSWPQMGQLTWDGSFKWREDLGIHQAEGSGALIGLAGLLDEQPYQLNANNLAFEGGQCEAKGIELSWAGNLATIDVLGLDPVALAQGKPVKGLISVDASQANVDAILHWWDRLDHQGPPSTNLLPSSSSVSLDFQAQTLTWAGLSCANLASKAQVSPHRLDVDALTFSALEGTADLRATLKPGYAGWALALAGGIRDVSLQELFKTYENFGQTMVRHEHLRGALSSEGDMLLSWGLDGSWHNEHMTASLQTSIAHGELIGFEVFDDVADYLSEHRLIAPLVDPEDLRRRLQSIQFNPVSQRVEVRQQSVRLPMTVIESSAMNVAVGGTYSFDETIDYTLGFALRDLRAGASDAFGEMEDDGLGSQFFLKMQGPIAQPEYKYDREAAKRHRRGAIQAEKERLKEAWQNRRNGDVDGSTPTPNPQPVIQPARTTPTEKKPSWKDRFKKSQGSQENDLFEDDDDDYF